MKKPVIVAAVITTALACVCVNSIQPMASADTSDVTFTYAGDSITARTDSWLYQLNDPGLISNGGYAESGYTSAQVLAGVTDHTGTDVLVIEVGTNDSNQGVGGSTILANIQKIAVKVNADHVLLIAAPPSNLDPDPTSHVNRTAASGNLDRIFQARALVMGWDFADPFAMLRDTDNSYLPGDAVVDGVHPTTAANTLVAAAMRTYIRQAEQITN